VSGQLLQRGVGHGGSLGWKKGFVLVVLPTVPTCGAAKTNG
jgi:hypothetical protein